MLVLVEERLAFAWAEGEVKAKLAELRVLENVRSRKNKVYSLGKCCMLLGHMQIKLQDTTNLLNSSAPRSHANQAPKHHKSSEFFSPSTH